MSYRKYASYLQEKYGEKIYKLPIHLPLTCPNRDGACGQGGCSFCGDVGAGFELLSDKLSIEEQLAKNKEYIGKKYKAKKFIAYFQNYTNTYMDLEDFKAAILAAIKPYVVEISISTRPDAVSADQLDFLEQVSKEHQLPITLEYGLQTVNYHQLRVINRGHTLAEYLEAVNMTKARGLKVCTHILLNLPGETKVDVIENAKILSALKTDYVKIHSLYILRDTKMGIEYNEGTLSLMTKDDYVEYVITFLQYLDPTIVIQRLLARAPKEKTLFCNWGMNWRRIQEEIEDVMKEKGAYQGQYFNYLGGKALRQGGKL